LQYSFSRAGKYEYDRSILLEMAAPDRPLPPPLTLRSKALRGAWARQGLRWLLDEYVYPEPSPARAVLSDRLLDILEPAAPEWTALSLLAFTLKDPPEVDRARARLRVLAEALARGREWREPPFQIDYSAAPLPERSATSGIHVAVHSAIDDAIVYATLQLLREIPSTLLRCCAIPECARVFVAAQGGQQRFCRIHQPLMRQARRAAAVRAFRQRQRQKKRPTPPQRRRRRAR
jgi:hypothetical protein